MVERPNSGHGNRSLNLSQTLDELLGITKKGKHYFYKNKIICGIKIGLKGSQSDLASYSNADDENSFPRNLDQFLKLFRIRDNRVPLAIFNPICVRESSNFQYDDLFFPSFRSTLCRLQCTRKDLTDYCIVPFILIYKVRRYMRMGVNSSYGPFHQGGGAILHSKWSKSSLVPRVSTVTSPPPSPIIVDSSQCPEGEEWQSSNEYHRPIPSQLTLVSSPLRLVKLIEMGN